MLLAGNGYDGYFLEIRSGAALAAFEPLRASTKGQQDRGGRPRLPLAAVRLEKKDIKRRLEEASRYAPLDQLAISPQCGFASTEEGNILTEEEQWAGLRPAVDAGEERGLGTRLTPRGPTDGLGGDRL